ncbi:MAG: glycosyltransferase [Bacteroidota bacterium]
MKIALISEYFYPKSKGGTEKYVYELAKKLISEENEVEVITVGPDGMENYHYEDVFVRVIEEENNNDKAVISGTKAARNLNTFATLLAEQQYEQIHFHTLTPAFSLHHIAAAKKTGAIIYFTAHVPAITCIHGDLMQFGQIACDGLILTHRCTACYLSKQSISKPLSKILATTINLINYPKSIANVVSRKKEDLFLLNSLCDQIFIFTTWQKRIFIANGIGEDKLRLTQQMTTPVPDQKDQVRYISKSPGKIRIAFVGRITHEKGIHILLNAIAILATRNLELHIAAIIENKNDPYFQKVMALTKGHSNIYWSYNLNQEEIQGFYQTVDLICIPSIWYETGPYVLYEAFKYKIPVIANNLGDMEIWEQKGYPIELYNDLNELISLLKIIIARYH